MRQFLLDLAPGVAAPVVGDSLLLGEGESHHLRRVMRLKVGTDVTLTDGEGRRYQGIYSRREGSRARIEIQASWQDDLELAQPRLVLACAVVKGRRFEWALEKSVELGVHRILPLHTDHTVVDPGEGKQDRWHTLLRSALKQTGRSYLPRLSSVSNLDTCLEQLHGGLITYGQWPQSDSTAAGSFPREQPRPAFLALVVGPEGGWSDTEAALLAAQAVPLTLAPHRLRTETAALAGLVTLQAWRQELLNDSQSRPTRGEPPP
jgi:16S rRNA (uracil1498-N3)-methyltransferase